MKAFVLTLILLVSLAVLGLLWHTPCSKDCQAAPAYFYIIPIAGTHYTTFYDDDDTGHLVPARATSSSSSGEAPANNGSNEKDHGEPVEEPPIEEEPHFSEP